MKHPNFYQVFEPSNKTVSQLAASLYNMRSCPLHTGQLGLGTTSTLSINELDKMKVMFVAQIARTAIINFVSAPQSILVGHPTIDPSPRIEFERDFYLNLQQRATEAGVSVSNWVKQQLHAMLAKTDPK